jgi:uncharacterized protein YndB with AHSA1/START domain
VATHRLEVGARSAAPPEVVFEVLADGARWQEWAGPTVPRSRWEREGVPPPGGVGAVRRLGRGPFGASEEILAYDPPRRLSYTVLSGLPVRSYRADVDLDADGDGTRIRWRATFEPKVPGTGALLARFLTVTLGSFARRLAAHAATRSAGLR